MKTKKIAFLLVAFVSFWSQNIQAQSPNWAVNASGFQYSMTFTSFLNVNGINLTSTNDKVAAFVNGEVRGVANVTYEASIHKHVVYLTVYANSNNETIQFKIYNSTADSVINIDKTVSFKIDGKLGNVFQSYSIAKPELNNSAVFNSFTFLEVSPVTANITADKINIVLPENTNVSNLTTVFNASDHSAVYVDGVLQQSGVSTNNFTNPVIYKVLSESQAVLTEYEVSVSLALNSDPVTVAISTTDTLKTNSVPVSVDITFSKAVSGFDVSDIQLENAVISGFFTSDSQTFQVSLVPLSQGDFSIQVPANSSLDENNNQNQISNKVAFSYDITKPMVTDISIGNDANSWWFLVSFNEEVLNVDISDFELAGIASNNVTISSINLVANNQYKIVVSNTNADKGTISLQLKSTSDIKDVSGNLIVYSEYEAYFLVKKEITITADVKTKVYGEVDPELTYTITVGSLENGDILTGSLSRVSGENIGDYAISSTLSNDNYDITFVSNNLSITKKTITITADSKTKVYGEEDPEFTHTITAGSLLNGDVLTGSLSRASGENVGDYAISSTLLNDNYNITFVSNNLSITKKEITLIADAKTKFYGEADPELTYTITAGSLENGDVFTGGLSRVAGENIGDYAISSTLSNDNYNITFVSNNLSITNLGSTRKEITITAEAKTKVYGEADPEFTYTITAGSLLNGDILTGSLSRVSGENVGDYAISSTLLNDNYNITFVSNNLSITKKEITLRADAKTKRVGDTDPELTYLITVGNLITNDVLTGSLTRETGETVGDYQISSTLSNSNYDITFISAIFRITAKPGIIISADAKAKVYGVSDPEFTYTITAGSLLNGDILTGSLSRVSGENIGDYAISSTLSNPNYDITFVSNNLTITKKTITITADSKTKVYGEEDPEFTYTITAGSLLNGDILIGSLSRVSGEDVGNYAISSTLSNPNYDITFVSNNLSITKKTITITADSKTKVYGEEDPEFTYTITAGSLLNGDILTGSLSRASGENVGDYAISSTLSNPNYDITFVSNNLSITKKEITLRADAKTKRVGDTDPELTYLITVGNLITNDVLTGSLTRETGETVGDYQISSTLSNSNYDITFISAIFRITAKPGIIISADAKAKVYGVSDPEFTYTITAGSLLNGDILTGSLSRVSGENIGDYAISSTLSNDNYDITFVSNNLSITKKVITITADAKTKVFGEVDPELTYSITEGNLINNDNFSGNLSREPGEEIGIYAIQQGSLSLGLNYAITFMEANFEINAILNSAEFNLITNINLYPNPTNDYLHIDTSEQLIINEIIIYNLVGKVVLQEKKKFKQLNLSYLNKGIYLIKIITERGVVLKRIVKK